MRATGTPQATGDLARTYLEALRLMAAQAEQGVPREERLAGLEKTLRAAWPQGREWKYLCERCTDTGWARCLCTADTPCGRPFRLPRGANRSGQPEYTGQGHCETAGHEYVVACRCARGQACRRGLEGRAPDGDVTEAGRTPTRMTRVGR